MYLGRKKENKKEAIVDNTIFKGRNENKNHPSYLVQGYKGKEIFYFIFYCNFIYKISILSRI